MNTHSHTIKKKEYNLRKQKEKKVLKNKFLKIHFSNCEPHGYKEKI